MKKIISIIALCLTTFIAFNACSDSDYDKRFPDPSKTSSVTVEKLMTGVFEAGNELTMPWYYRLFTFDLQILGRYAQVMGYINDPSCYEPSESYSKDRWDNFYKIVTQYRLQENVWGNMEETLKPENEVFLKLSSIYIYDHLQQLIDIWGDVPFNEAGYLGLTGDIQKSKAKYDSAEELYKQMMNDLKSINSYLATYEPTALVNSKLKAQDYINMGDLSSWRRYCNSLRLRIASRAAENGSITAEARAALSEILSDPTTYPVVTTNDESIMIRYQAPDLTAYKGGSQEIRDAFESWNGSLNRAIKPYIEQLIDDPRLEILYDTNAEGMYVGIDPLMESSAQQRLFDRPTAEGGNYFSAIDTATISRNRKVPGILLTAAEVDFIRAEAILKWGVAGSAEESFKSGMKKSIDFYYAINNDGDYREPIPAPSVEEIEEAVNRKWDSYENKAEGIAIQRWINYGPLQLGHAWSEYRKTGYPQLQFRTVASTTLPTPPNRLLYVSSEKSYNAENYAAVQAKDNYETKIFWAK